jgi:hypothetical protein
MIIFVQGSLEDPRNTAQVQHDWLLAYAIRSRGEDTNKPVIYSPAEGNQQLEVRSLHQSECPSTKTIAINDWSYEQPKNKVEEGMGDVFQ